LFPAEHTTLGGIPFGSEHPPEEDAHADRREAGDREKKNSND